MCRWSRSTAEAPASPAQSAACGDTVYVSFNFPKPDNPINHYDITPPDGTIMVDNGDSTAYFAGTCVQGKYGYKYVVVTHDEKKRPTVPTCAKVPSKSLTDPGSARSI